MKEAENLDIDEMGEHYAFIIRSNNDDNVHKSLKYRIWTSTEANNERLSETYKKA